MSVPCRFLPLQLYLTGTVVKSYDEKKSCILMIIHMEKPLLKSLLQMVSVIEARDTYTGGHLWRVSQYCHLLADKAGLPADRPISHTSMR